MRTDGEHDEKHLAFIRSLHCVICGDDTSVEACHIRFADASLAKLATGISIKPADYWTVPLCGAHHRRQHQGNERKFWIEAGINPLPLAMRLFTVTGNHQRGLAVLRAVKQ